MDVSPIAQFFASNDTKFYIALAGALWTAFKGFNWVKDIREKDLKGIKDDLAQQNHLLGTGFTALSNGITELRSDFRTFYTSPDPVMVPVRARTVRKCESVSNRKQAKAKSRAKRAPRNGSGQV
jgi:hypothetical protein